MVIREFLTRLGFDADESKVRSFDGAVNKLAISLGAAVGIMTTAAAAAFKLASASAAYGDEVAKTARTIGISGQGLQEYRFAFDRLGVSQGEATAGLERFNRAIGRAAAGSTTEANAFARLGLNIRDADGELRSMEALLPEAADALAAITNESERAAMAQDLFGRSGGRLAMALASGGAEIERLREEFRLLGGGLSQDQLDAAEDFTDAMTNLRTVLNGLRLQIGAELMPVFQPLIEAFTQFMVMNRQIILSGARVFFQNLTEAIQRLVAAGQEVLSWFGRIFEAINRLSGSEKWALALGAAILLWRRLGVWGIISGVMFILDELEIGRASCRERVSVTV